jgi:hypothetical protein
VPQSACWTPAWRPIAKRTVGVLFGLGLAIWGNYLPKLLSPWAVGDEPFDWQRVHRFGGWIASLGGAAVVVVALLFPLEATGVASSAIIGTVTALIVGRTLISHATYSTAPR